MFEAQSILIEGLQVSDRQVFCLINGIHVSAAVLKDESVNCTVPAHILGEVTIDLVDENYRRITSNPLWNYSYVEVPHLTMIQPDWGSTLISNNVSIYGNKFIFIRIFLQNIIIK